jgi:hypothetical protein
MIRSDRSASHNTTRTVRIVAAMSANACSRYDRELLIVNRNLSGQSYAGVEVGSELELGSRLSDGGCRSFARFQRREIQDRGDLDEAAQLLSRCRSTLYKDAPGEARRPSGEHVIQGVRAERQRSREVIELELALSRARDRKRQRAGYATQAGIGGQDAQHRLGPG